MIQTGLTVIICCGMAATARSAPVVQSYGDLSAFTLAAGSVSVEGVFETQTLLPDGSNQFTLFPAGGGLFTHMGFTADTAPLGPGTGFLVYVVLPAADPVLVGVYGGNMDLVSGFFGYSSNVPFTQLVIRAGPHVPGKSAIQETMTVDNVYFGRVIDVTEVPEPGAFHVVLFALVILFLWVYIARKDDDEWKS
jgi:hypothetical protein